MSHAARSSSISINFFTGKFTFKLKKIFQSISLTFPIKIERSLNESILKKKIKKFSTKGASI